MFTFNFRFYTYKYYTESKAITKVEVHRIEKKTFLCVLETKHTVRYNLVSYWFHSFRQEVPSVCSWKLQGCGNWGSSPFRRELWKAFSVWRYLNYIWNMKVSDLEIKIETDRSDNLCFYSVELILKFWNAHFKLKLII